MSLSFDFGFHCLWRAKKLWCISTKKSICKHLIGNGWSIPVVEFLLGKLCDVFDEGSQNISYEEYEYKYSWAP
jgi:hypothetical protein